MAKPLLSNADFCRAAKKLRCDVEAIKAVDQIESRGSGFYADGHVILLFERHLFRRFTNGRFNKNYPELSGPPGNYGAGGANQIRKFSTAFTLDPTAAIKACSWGRYQILGSNYAVCGYSSPEAFLTGMRESEGKQLDAFVSFVIGNKLDNALRTHNWTAFARGYNGSAYAKSGYHTKIANAYAKLSKKPIDCSKVSATASSTANSIPDIQTPVSDSPVELDTATPQLPTESPVVQNADQIINTGDQSNTPPPVDKTLAAPTKDGATSTATTTTVLGIAVPPTLYAIFQGISDWVEKGYIDAKEIGSTLLGLLRENYKYVFILIALIIVILIVKKVVKQITFWIQMITAAVPQWNTIKVVPTAEAPAKAWYQFWK